MVKLQCCLTRKKGGGEREKCDKPTVDCRKYCQLSSTDVDPIHRAKCLPLSRPVNVSTIDVPWQNVLSPELKTKFQKEVVGLLLFCRYLNFLITECTIGRRKFPCQKPARSVHAFRQNTDL